MTRGEWIGLGLLACAVRAVHVWLATESGDYDVTSLDGAFYRDAALAIASGEGREARPYLLSPLYPYLLAPFVSGGVLNEVAVRVAQSLLGVGSALLTAALAGRLAGRPAAWVAGILAATFGPMVHFEAQVALAGPQAFFLLLALWLWLRDEDGGRGVWLLGLAGLAFGVGAAIRPTVLAVGATVALAEPLFALYERTAVRPALRRSAAIALGMFLVIAPFTVRNAWVGGEPVLLSAAGGMNLWIGNHADASGLYQPPPGYDFDYEPMARDIAERESGRSLSHGEASSWWSQRALGDIVGDPVRWLGLMARKTLLLLHPVEIPNLGVGYEDFEEDFPTLWKPIDARVILLVALLTPMLLEPGAQRRRAARLWWAVLAYAAAVGLFFVTGRYRLPVLPAAIALAAAGSVGVFRLARRSEWKGRLLAAAPLLAIVLSIPVFDGENAWLRLSASEGGERHEAERLTAQGRLEEAVAAYRRALQTENTAIARVNLAALLAELGRPREAARELAAAIALEPDDPVAHHNQGLLGWHTLGHPAEAERSFRRAIELRPDYAEAHLHLGQLLLERRRPDEALPFLERAVELTTAATPEGRSARIFRDRAQRQLERTGAGSTGPAADPG